MKRLSIACVALLASSTLGARAEILFTLAPPVYDFPGAPGAYSYGGTIVNTGVDAVVIDGFSLAVPDVVTFFTVIDDLVLGDLPLTLTGGGGSYSSDDLFELTVPNGLIDRLGSVFLDASGVQVAAAEFAIPAPEPASMAVLAAGLAGSAVMRRRRRGAPTQA